MEGILAPLETKMQEESPKIVNQNSVGGPATSHRLGTG